MDRLAISSVKVMSESQLLGREEVESFIERLRLFISDQIFNFASFYSSISTDFKF